MKFICNLLSYFYENFCFRTIRTKKIILEDENGNAKVELEIDKQGNTILHFNDENKQTRLYLGITSEGTPRIGLSYAGGKGSIQLEANDKLNSSAIVFSGPDGKPQILLGIASTGLPAFGLYDNDGKLLFPHFKNLSPENSVDTNTRGLFLQN